MTKKTWILIAAALVLAGVYVFYFADWFKPKTISISHVSRATRMRARTTPAAARPSVLPVTFSLQGNFKLNDLKVIPLAALQTNQNALPIWHLTSDSNSIPIKIFNYGQYIRGMKPSVPGMRPATLETNVTYRLFVKAGSIQGQHDFQPVPAPAQ